jgi:hypothetical protein
MSIAIARDSIGIEAGGKRFTYRIDEKHLRVIGVDTIAIGHTNISRGYKTLRISKLKTIPLPDARSDRREPRE